MPRWEYLLAFVGVGAAFWNQTKAIFAWIKSWVIVTKKHDYTTGLLLLSYMENTLRRSRARNAAYGSGFSFVKPLERVYRIIYQSLYGGTQTFWKGRRPIWYAPASVNPNEGNSNRRDFHMEFSFLRGSMDWEKHLLAAADWDDSARQGLNKRVTRFRVRYHFGSTMAMELAHATKSLSDSNAPISSGEDWNGPTRGVRLLRWSWEDIQGFSIVSTMDNLSLRPELTKVVEELTFWHASDQWYREHGVPWRRGAVFHGDPGTGKTSLARALAEQLDMPVHVFDLAGMSNQDLKRAWRDTMTDTPCMVLLEDLDAVFDGRKNVVPQTGMGSGGLTFDCLLNCIDGIERSDGVLLIVTTNKLEKLDDALKDRPGRIDRVVKFETLDMDGRVKLATRILEDAALAQRMATDYYQDSAARFQERCFQVALERHFGTRP